MGFETFRVELEGGAVTHRDAQEAVRELPNVRPDCDSIPLEGSAFFVIDDGHHIVEIEVKDAPVRLSCRFTLCHPSSVDSMFLNMVQKLLVRLGMEVRICDDIHPEHARSFALSEFAEFSVIAARYACVRRAEWNAAFGDEPMAATTNDAYQRIILPRCQPEIEQPTAGLQT